MVTASCWPLSHNDLVGDIRIVSRGLAVCNDMQHACLEAAEDCVVSENCILKAVWEALCHTVHDLYQDLASSTEFCISYLLVLVVLWPRVRVR